MSENVKKVLLGEGFGEIVEKKSRFIAGCYEIHSEEDALKKIEELRKQYWDARHNCYAYVVGPNNEVQRFSDDKEPQGTAGKPILDVLLNNDLRNTLIVVTRYFGGVLLGTGGLVRAYSSAASEGIKNSPVSEIYEGIKVIVSCDYSSLGKVQYITAQLAEFGICLTTDTAYAEDVKILLLVENSLVGSLKSKITEATSGQAIIEEGDVLTFALKNGEPVILE